MKRQQRGMALVIVLWLIVLLGVMAAGHAGNAHVDNRLAGRQADVARARNLAEAGINRMILELLAVETVTPARADGRVSVVEIGGRNVNLAIRNALGLVDINAAAPDLLKVLLGAAGAGDEELDRLVDEILDWRDADDLRRMHGFEDGDYAMSGVSWRSADAAFTTVEELRYLPAMRPELFERIAPLVTVHSGRGGVRLEFAPPILVAAIAGDESGTRDPGAAVADDDRRNFRHQNGTYHIYAAAEAGSETMVSVEAVVRISRSSRQPFLILEWRDPARFAPRAAASTTR